MVIHADLFCNEQKNISSQSESSTAKETWFLIPYSNLQDSRDVVTREKVRQIAKLESQRRFSVHFHFFSPFPVRLGLMGVTRDETSIFLERKITPGISMMDENVERSFEISME